MNTSSKYEKYEVKLNADMTDLITCYQMIHPRLETNGIIEENDYIFNNHKGDITKNIRWTWAINPTAISMFESAIENIIPELNSHFSNRFMLFGASFITLNEKEIKDSEFHLDVNSMYDTKHTDILTLIFPLIIDQDMGGLEYIENGETLSYKYNPGYALVWDSCKLMHRTQPYKLPVRRNRVIVSINMVSEQREAINSIRNTLKYQGLVN